MAYSPNLDRLLRVGASYEHDGISYVVDACGLDDVVLPSGHVVGCDPFTIFEATAAFDVTVSPGTYPAKAWVATVDGNDVERHQRVAALQLLIDDEPTSRWEMALTEGQDLESLSDGQFWGYAVDGGTGTLADLVAVRALSKWDWEHIEDVFFPGSRPLFPRPVSAPKRSLAIELPLVPGARTVVVDDDSAANVVTVESGWGDGAYPTFIGYALDGRVTSFVTDFLVVPH